MELCSFTFFIINLKKELFISFLTWLPGSCWQALPHAKALSLPNFFHRPKCLNDNSGESSEVRSCYISIEEFAFFYISTEAKQGFPDATDLSLKSVFFFASTFSVPPSLSQIILLFLLFSTLFR